jgi:hypothetical protein
MQKLYCYVDETGQDTSGKFLLVSLALFGAERDDILNVLETIEQKSGKGKVKWIRVKDDVRRAYLDAVLANPSFHGNLMYAVYRDTTAYTQHLAQTVKLAIERVAEPDYKATIIVDGLEGRQKQLFTNLIRSLGVRHKTVRGMRDETDAFIRLADAICGFARAGLHDHIIFAPMLKRAQEREIIIRL